MKKTQIKRSLRTLACTSALVVSSVANATPYLLHQGEFSGGGEINLTFEGVDVNGDGLISAWQQGEVSQGFLTFTGNADVRDFASSLTSNELLLIFKVGENGAGDDPSIFQGVYITVDPDDENKSGDMVFRGYFARFGVAPGPSVWLVGSVTSVIESESIYGRSPESRSPITISEVPEPGRLMSTALGLATLVVYGRRQSA